MARLFPARRLRRLARRLHRDERGVSILELALVLPVMLTLGLYGTELAYMTTVDMQVSMIATSVADNASRLGQTDNSSVTPTVTEAQVDSVMKGALAEGAPFVFKENGRIILSSLEKTGNGKQYIHWQRCAGDLKHGSAYGGEGAGKTGATLDGMGKTGHKIYAATNSAVMYVEVYYDYQPLFGTAFVSNPTFHHEAAYLIRDDRNLEPGVTGGNNTNACS